jgi:hypothetical protein
MAKKKRPPTSARPSTNAGDAAPTAKRTASPARLASARRGRRKGNPWPWIVGLGGLALIVAVQITVNVVRELNAPGERFASQGNVHVSLGTSTPAYNSDPPTSGWHTPDLAAWGSYLDAPPDQQLIHNLEDGGVVLYYAAGTPEENEAHVDALEEVVGGRYARVVIAPREGMPTTYAATAWQRLARFESLDVAAMQAFLAAYHGLDHHPR